MGEQANRITVSLPSTLFDTKRNVEVELPMTCNAPAITPRIAGGPVLMWLVVGCSVIAAFRGAWVMGVFAALMVPLAAAATTQIFARLLIGDQQIILGEEGLLDTRYGTVPVPWSAFRKATILYAKRHLLGVMLYYREPPATLPPMIGHLATSGWPFGLRQRMQVELKSVWNREIVASTIKFLVERHTVDQADTKRS